MLKDTGFVEKPSVACNLGSPPREIGQNLISSGRFERPLATFPQQNRGTPGLFNTPEGLSKGPFRPVDEAQLALGAKKCAADVQRLLQKTTGASRCLRKHKIVVPAKGTFQKPTPGGVAHLSGGFLLPIQRVGNPCLLKKPAVSCQTMPPVRRVGGRCPEVVPEVSLQVGRGKGPVTPVKTGIQVTCCRTLDSRFRGNDNSCTHVSRINTSARVKQGFGAFLILGKLALMAFSALPLWWAADGSGRGFAQQYTDTINH
jgi:hypothetical protein